MACAQPASISTQPWTFGTGCGVHRGTVVAPPSTPRPHAAVVAQRQGRLPRGCAVHPAQAARHTCRSQDARGDRRVDTRLAGPVLTPRPQACVLRERHDVTRATDDRRPALADPHGDGVGLPDAGSGLDRAPRPEGSVLLHRVHALADHRDRRRPVRVVPHPLGDGAVGAVAGSLTCSTQVLAPRPQLAVGGDRRRHLGARGDLEPGLLRGDPGRRQTLDPGAVTELAGVVLPPPPQRPVGGEGHEVARPCGHADPVRVLTDPQGRRRPGHGRTGTQQAAAVDPAPAPQTAVHPDGGRTSGRRRDVDPPPADVERGRLDPRDQGAVTELRGGVLTPGHQAVPAHRRPVLQTRDDAGDDLLVAQPRLERGHPGRPTGRLEVPA